MDGLPYRDMDWGNMGLFLFGWNFDSQLCRSVGLLLGSDLVR